MTSESNDGGPPGTTAVVLCLLSIVLEICCLAGQATIFFSVPASPLKSQVFMVLNAPVLGILWLFFHGHEERGLPVFFPLWIIYWYLVCLGLSFLARWIWTRLARRPKSPEVETDEEDEENWCGP